MVTSRAALHESTCEPRADQSTVGSSNLFRHVLRNGKSTFVVHLDALRVTDEHIDHAVHVTDADHIVV